MGFNKKKLVSYLTQLVMAAGLAVVVYITLSARLNVLHQEHAIYAKVPKAWEVRCWSDALFIPAVIWVGLGGLIYVSSTDFFDIFRYGFSSVLVLFTPFRKPAEHPHYYEYKQERAKKRAVKAEETKAKGGIASVLVVGLVLMAGAVALSFAHERMVEPYRAEYAVTAPAEGEAPALVNSDTH